MKNKLVTSLLVALLAISQTCIAQIDTIGVSPFQPGLPDSIIFGTSQNIRFIFENRGSTVFQGILHYNYGIKTTPDSIDIVIMDSTSNPVTLNPSDTVGITINENFSGPLYKPGGGNTVVIWPIAQDAYTADSIFWEPVLHFPLSIGTNSLRKLEYKIIPNPSSDFIEVVTIEKNTPEQVRIYDLNGRLVEDHINTNRIDISHLPTGNYTIGVRTDGYQLEFLPFVKE